MITTILKGNIVSAASFGKLDITENGYLIAENGIIKGIFQNLPEKYSSLPIEDYSNNLILQSFSDLHLHAPQYPMLGMGMDLPLLDWLNTYTFPTEAMFNDNNYARKVYKKLAKELIENGTTRVCMFSSLHREATLILMEELENAGITGYVGKVNMDRNSNPLLQETTKESIEETLKWLDECKRFQYIKPMITPRFTPSCSDELMENLGKIADKYHLPIQSHLSENTNEIAWVQELHTDCTHLWALGQRQPLQP
ncbi:amidohydrolase family protein [Dorea formicigenerans]|uniref:amidohydrolase family protein n=1 Tax=Dorea formicigenerans TaxID=39486 RepID=UPI00156E784E|nr:amidohydrolase family protein [Dorea formicigenerans]NSK20822.1 amidohydrolase family protein [Dorea formicigenerans]